MDMLMDPALHILPAPGWDAAMCFAQVDGLQAQGHIEAQALPGRLSRLELSWLGRAELAVAATGMRDRRSTRRWLLRAPKSWNRVRG
jgi:hypothetical protein